MPNRFVPINPGSDINQVIAIMNKNFAELDAEANAKVYYGSANQVAVNQGQLANNSGTGIALNDLNAIPTLALSVSSAGTATLKVAAPGVNVFNASVLSIGQVATGYVGMKISDGTNDTFFAGRDSSGNTVIRVAKAGFDVKTATSDQLIFNSSQNVLKINKIMSISVTLTGGNQFNSTTLAHGLSFTPALLAYIQVPSSLSGNNPDINHANPALIYGTVAGVFRTFALAEVTVDGTNIRIGAQTDNSVGVGTYTWTAKVYLTQESFI